MQLAKKDINVSNKIANKNTQITIDDNVNVPDIKGDIDKIISSNGKVFVEAIEPMVDKVKIIGQVEVSVLYGTNDGAIGLDAMDNTINFEELINVDDVLPGHEVSAKLSLDDLDVTMINSRKISIKGLMKVNIEVLDNDVIEAAKGIENGESIQCLYKQVRSTENTVNKKDVCRVKESLDIPASKPNIYEIIWKKIYLNNVLVKPMDSMLGITGELQVFIIYRGEEEGMPMQNMYVQIPFNENLECVESMDDMVGDIDVSLGNVDFQVRPDTDGELRVIDVDAHLPMNICLYEDKNYELLSDVYSPSVDIGVTTKDFMYDNLLVKNSAKTRVSDRLNIGENQSKMLQICYVDGEVKIDDTKVVEDGIAVEGVVVANIIYIAEDDRHPVNSMTGMIPFNYLVETKGLRNNDNFKVSAKLEQISGIMIDSDEIELKAMVNVDAIVFSSNKSKAIVEMEVKPIDYSRLSELPGIIGYIVQEDDTLWSLAKKYYTTSECIKEMNSLDKDELAPGRKLVIVSENVVK